MKGLTSEGLMGAVAKRALLRILTGTEIDGAIGLGLIRHGRKRGTLMGTVAKRLRFAVSTRAPVIGLTGFNEHREGGLLRDMGGGHDEKMTEGR
jgi:hypothetical protein